MHPAEREARPEAAPLPWVCRMMQACDSAYPTGAYAHSAGLEGLVQAGVVRDAATLESFLHGQFLPQLARCELPLAAAAWEAAGGTGGMVGAAEVPGGGPDWGRLRELCLLGRALRGTRELRAASEAVGRQRLEMASLLHGGLASEFQARAREGGWPVPSCVAAGVEGRLLGAPREAVLQALLYAAVSGLVAAAMKLLRLGQNAVQRLVAGGLANCNELLDTACSLTDAELGSFNPWWDIASSRHERADFRLFIS